MSRWRKGRGRRKFGWTNFSVACQCGHVNLPHRSPRKSAAKVIEGKFTCCEDCGKKFVRIRVPNRPMVREMKDDGINIAPFIEFYDYSNRKAPMASGKTTWGMRGNMKKKKLFGFRLDCACESLIMLEQDVSEIQFQTPDLFWDFGTIVPQFVSEKILAEVAMN